MLLACGDGRPQHAAPVPVIDPDREAPGVLSLANRHTFVDGAELSQVSLEPMPVEPGTPLAVRWIGRGRDATARIRLHSPQSAGHQEVRHGSQRSTVAQTPGVERRVPFRSGSVDLSVPQPWHSSSAVVTLERFVGEHRLDAIEGPRMADGTAIIAVAPVIAVPTGVRAQSVTHDAIEVDGRLQEQAWSNEPAELVESRHGAPVAGDPTKVWFAWSQQALYMAAEIPDQDVWSTYDDHDDPLWKQEVIELFVSGTAEGRNYLEFQVNPRGTTFDAHFVRYREGNTDWDSEFTSAVDVRGTVEERNDRDQGWTVELAVPWSEICEHTAVECPVQSGAKLRVNVFRFERPAQGGAKALALSPTRVADFHAWDNAARLELTP